MSENTHPAVANVATPLAPIKARHSTTAGRLMSGTSNTHDGLLAALEATP
jgi:hypothetical protein